MKKSIFIVSITVIIITLFMGFGCFKVIGNSKENLAQSSAYAYLSAVELKLTRNSFSGDIIKDSITDINYITETTVKPDEINILVNSNNICGGFIKVNGMTFDILSDGKLKKK